MRGVSAVLAFLCAPKMRDRTRAVLFLVIALTFGCVLGATAKFGFGFALSPTALPEH